MVSLHLHDDQAAPGSTSEGRFFPGRSVTSASLAALLPLRDNALMSLPNIDLTPLRKAHALLSEAVLFWNAQPEGTPLNDR